MRVDQLKRMDFDIKHSGDFTQCMRFASDSRSKPERSLRVEQGVARTLEYRFLLKVQYPVVLRYKEFFEVLRFGLSLGMAE